MSQQTNINEINEWSQKIKDRFDKMKLELFNLVRKGPPGLGIKGKLTTYEEFSADIQNIINQKAPEAYHKFIQFHELEYRLHLLNTVYSNPTLKEFTESELNQLFEWLKVFLVTILITSHQKVYTKETFPETITYGTGKYQSVSDLNVLMDETNEVWRSPYKSIYASYEMLVKANTLKEKIKAITLTLNAMHSDGKLLTKDTWKFAPFTREQFDKLNYINPKKVESELKKDIG